MAQIILDITPASALVRTVDALCGFNNYQATIDGVANPESRNQFAKRMVAIWLKQQVASWESNIASAAAKAAAEADANSLSIT